MKRIIKTTIYVIIMVILGYLIYDNYYEITNGIEMLYTKYFQSEIRQTLKDSNYRKKVNYSYFKINESTKIKNIDDAKNALYTMVDAGWDKYTVKCDKTYEKCLDEVKTLLEDDDFIAAVDGYVHTFNSIVNIKTTYKSTGIIEFNTTKRYSESQINEISKVVDKVYNEYYDPSKNVRDNIRIFHDYIVQHTTPNIEQKNSSNLNDVSFNAYGVLVNGTGLCSGYSDAMALFLEKMHVNNFKVHSKTHMWNVVYVEGVWYHLDVTWDDPTGVNDPNFVDDRFFLISHDTLKDLTDVEHEFNENIYIEAK